MVDGIPRPRNTVTKSWRTVVSNQGTVAERPTRGQIVSGDLGVSDTRPVLSVVTLNYRNPDMTAKCVNLALRSAAAAGLSAEAIVVDNSASETGPSLRTQLDQAVSVISNAQNLGFARSSNQGISATSGDYVLLLNNDAFVESECLSLGVTFLRSNPKVGIWAPKLVGPDGTLQVSCARLPTVKGLAGEYFLGRCVDWYEDPSQWAEPTGVESVIGAFLLVPRRVIERVGLLDEDYFFNGEDVDYCKRVLGAGYSVIYDPRCEVVHLGGASRPSGPWAFVQNPGLHRSRKVYFRKHRSKGAALLASALISTGLTFRRMRMRLCLRPASQL